MAARFADAMPMLCEFAPIPRHTMKPVGPCLQGMLTRFPKLLVQLVYLLIHLSLSTATMSIAVVLWHSQVAHFLFLAAISFSTVRNAAAFYFEVFEKQYQRVLDPSAGEDKTMSKKLAAASATLGDLTKPLAKA